MVKKEKSFWDEWGIIFAILFVVATVVLYVVLAIGDIRLSSYQEELNTGGGNFIYSAFCHLCPLDAVKVEECSQCTIEGLSRMPSPSLSPAPELARMRYTIEIYECVAGSHLDKTRESGYAELINWNDYMNAPMPSFEEWVEGESYCYGTHLDKWEAECQKRNPDFVDLKINCKSSAGFIDTKPAPSPSLPATGEVVEEEECVWCELYCEQYRDVNYWIFFTYSDCLDFCLNGGYMRESTICASPEKECLKYEDYDWWCLKDINGVTVECKSYRNCINRAIDSFSITSDVCNVLYKGIDENKRELCVDRIWGNYGKSKMKCVEFNKIECLRYREDGA